MPVYETTPMYAKLLSAPVDIVPLYAVLTILHQKLSGRPVGSCVLSSHQIAGALRHLGFDAEPVAAHASVYRVTETFTEVSEIGVWKRPPTVRPDGMVTGHMVVWAPAFARLVDPTLVQDPTLFALAQRDPIYSIPICAPAATTRTAFMASKPVITLTDNLHAAWLLLPDWTSLMDAVLVDDLAVAATLGAHALAIDALDLIADLRGVHDWGGAGDLNPRLGALLDGADHLSPLPPPPPGWPPE